MADETPTGGAPGNEPPTSPLHREAPPAPPTPPPDWREGITDDVLRQSPALKDFKDVNGLAQSFVDTQKMMSRALVFPSDDATPEAWKDVFSKAIDLSGGKLINMPDPTDLEAMQVFHKAMGVPVEGESYTIPDNVPQEFVDKIMEHLPRYQKMGLSQQQVNGLIAESLEGAANQQAAMEARQLENKAELKKEFGMNFDEVFTATENYMVNTDVPEQARDIFKSGDMHPDLAKWFMNQARKAGSEGNNLTRDNNPLNTETADELQIRLNDLREKVMTLPPGDASRQAYLNRMVEIQERISGEKVDQVA